ncbi:HEAT repeat domain-containing protein [Natronomonas sp. EA1]|uniref:HEAT repeat domain-containing protein n=1 Tax=Natronomonas sp. EA1 TaxID=3421655 RepID=UPI003EB82EE9
MEQPPLVEEYIEDLSTFLTDDDRAVRLTTAKLFVTVAESLPRSVLPAVEALADRLADDEEFYYVRARAAEALGYVALESPAAVTDPATLADLRIGLSFDEPAVKRKLAKALTHVALGDPGRLRHHADSLAVHLDDEDELVRYHLSTTLVVIACAFPDALTEAAGPLSERLTDPNPYVAGRAAEALGVLAPAGIEADAAPDIEEIEAIEASHESPPAFLTDRLAFYRGQVDSPSEPVDGLGTVSAVREGLEAVVEEMRTPADETCPSCGFELPDDGPPMCPRCGIPR